jgi:signal transduction histidine kinase
MGLASITTGAFVVLAACTALYNLWLFALRPEERAHLWLAVAALGVVGIGTGLSMVYESTDLASARIAHTVALAPAPLLVTGFLRFTAVFLGVRMDWSERVAGIFTLAFVIVFVANPDWFFSGERIDAIVFGEHHVEAAFRPTLGFALPGFLAMFAGLIGVFTRHRSKLGGGKILAASIVIWTLAACNDVMIAVGAYRAPYLVTMGFVGFAMAFTGLLVRRFVASVGQLEASTVALHQVVEGKSQELRDKDHQLTHGARMATVGAISAGLAHEIHRPVSIVSDHLKNLEAAFKDPDDPDRFERLLVESRQGIERIRGIVSDLLRISRRDAEDEGAVSMVSAVESVLPMAQSEARSRAAIVTELQPVPPIHGSETLLAQVVLNLLVNALRSIPEGKPEDNAVTVRTSFEDGSVWLTVQDTGPGIPETRLANLFDPFAATDEPDAGQVGLGMAVTHQLVSRYRGTIDVENSPSGARFIVEFPPMEVAS